MAVNGAHGCLIPRLVGLRQCGQVGGLYLAAGEAPAPDGTYRRRRSHDRFSPLNGSRSTLVPAESRRTTVRGASCKIGGPRTASRGPRPNGPASERSAGRRCPVCSVLRNTDAGPALRDWRPGTPTAYQSLYRCTKSPRRRCSGVGDRRHPRSFYQQRSPRQNDRRMIAPTGPCSARRCRE